MTRLVEFARRIAILAVLALFASAASCSPTDSSAVSALETLEITSGHRVHTFMVEYADDDDERRIGLMYRSSMPADHGMLFNFGPKPQPVSMWMKNTLIPLDMAFIAADGRIVRIAENTTPRSLASIASGEPVLAVLEVNGGRLSALGVRSGDVVHHPLFNNQ
ncbi:MAG: DUF192 domain-containing protein [Parvularculaceae bacterium]|nr:DUF192 domain-containing protein [Parvularculaceae bacterium]